MEIDELNNPMPVYSVYPQKCAVLIDGGYWEKVRESLGNPEVDMLLLSEYLSKPAYRMRTYYFDGKHETRQQIHDQLEMLDRFEVILGDVVERETKCKICKKSYKIYEQKRVDVLISVNLVHLASTKQVDTIVLIASDRDFLPVVEVAKAAGVIIKLAYGGKGSINVAPGLFKSADERIKLTENLLKGFPISNKEDKIEEIKGEKDEFIEDEIVQIKNKINNCIREIIKSSGNEKLPMGVLGFHLQKNGIKFKGSLSNMVQDLNSGVKVKNEKEDTYITLEDRTELDSLIDLGLKEDKAVKFLVNTLNELLEETKTKTIPINHLSSKMHTNNPNWKKEYGYPINNAFTKLVKRAKKILVFTGKNVYSGEIGLNSEIELDEFFK